MQRKWHHLEPDQHRPPGAGKYWLSASAQALPAVVCSIWSSYFCHCALVTAPQLHVSVMSIFFNTAVSQYPHNRDQRRGPGACYIHSLSQLRQPRLGRTTPNVLPGRVITEYLMGMQGHLDLQSQVLALQRTASSIIDRGKPIRTICSPQRSAGAA